MKKVIIAVDFDGTCVTHDFPDIGKSIGAEKVLKRFVEKGHRLILHTVRAGEHEDNAVSWFKENGIPLFGINENPHQHHWSTSRKTYAEYYIDDAAVGCPLSYDEDLSDRGFADWDKIEEYFEFLNII